MRFHKHQNNQGNNGDQSSACTDIHTYTHSINSLDVVFVIAGARNLPRELQTEERAKQSNI